MTNEELKKVIVSDECKGWLAKANMSDVLDPAKAEVIFMQQCEKIKEDVFQAMITESKEPASPDGKAEIVVEVKLLKEAELDLMMVATNVYAVVYTTHNSKYYVKLDNEGNPKKSLFLGNDIALKFNKGVRVVKYEVVKFCKYSISM